MHRRFNLFGALARGGSGGYITALMRRDVSPHAGGPFNVPADLREHGQLAPLTGRRAFLAGVGALSLAAISCGRSGASREAALHELVTRVLVPDARAIGAATAALEASLLQLAAAQGDAGLEPARQAWRSAALTWQRSAAFPHGPYVETRALLRAAYWPIRADAIEQLLRGSEPIDAARVAQLGVNVKGLYAIESLLFETDASGLAWPLGPLRPRVLAMLTACAADVRSYAEHANAALGDGSKFAREFSSAGQRSVDHVLKGVVETVESAVIRIERVLVMPTATTRSGRASYVPQGGPSGTSTQLLETWLEVCERVYGTGLASLVVAAAPEIHRHATSAFAAARAALAGLDQPIERAVQSARPRLTAAQQTLRQLEVSLRSELASALGVTITFTSHDGD